jgi:plastocyanin domain-containing protein
MKRVTAGILAIVFCFSSAVAAREAKKTVRATVAEDGVQRVEILGGGYYFDPDHIIVKVNVPVELKVRKDGWLVPHDIVVKAPEAGIDFRMSLDTQAKVIRFTPTKTGIYPMYCSKDIPWLPIASHREKGMEGELEVVE